MPQSKFSVWLKSYLGLLALILAAGSIYLLPYIRQSYHRPLMAVLGITNTQLGLMNSVFGVTAMIRASLSFYNTFEEVDLFIEALTRIRSMF